MERILFLKIGIDLIGKSWQKFNRYKSKKK